MERRAPPLCSNSNGFEHVTYIDVRPLLSNELPTAYKKSWDNELHPTDGGYALVAEKFDQTISQVAPLPDAGGLKAPRATTPGPSGKHVRSQRTGKAPARRGRDRSR